MDTVLTQAILIMLATTLYGALGSLVLLRSDRLSSIWGTALAIIGSIGAVVAGGIALTGAQVYGGMTTSFALLTLSVHVDRLSGIFLVVIGAVGALGTIYGYRYMAHHAGTYRLGGFFAFYNLFLASMMLVVIANQALFFLFAWELMALASYFLVIFDHHNKENVRAGYLYFIMTHIATAFIIFLTFIFYRATGSLDFDAWRLGSSDLSSMSAALVFVFALVGFGTKSGIIPLHVWLPSAHPAAPSHVSALMSGVMIKLGIYMLIRVFMDFFLVTPHWLGLTILLLGATSSVLGVLYALGEHDIKRLLAYHSIENIGIILLGLGAALVFRTAGESALSILALAASLFHVVNHAIFKSLLFLSAGSVVHATGTRNMEEYGGLGKRMPYTALFFLVGSIAISGIIPFNGFVSEWLTFQSLFGGMALSSVFVKSVFAFCVAALALTGGLAAACFVKAFGVTFLARPRSETAERAHDSSLDMNIAMGILASAALLLGIFGTSATKLFVRIAESISPAKDMVLSASLASSGTMVIRENFAVLNMMTLVALLSAALFVVWFTLKVKSGKNRIVENITWDCGFPLTPRMEITSTAFAHSIITIFRPILRSLDSTKRTHVTNEQYVTATHSVHLHPRDLYMQYCYLPVVHAILRIARVATKIQNGYVNMYVLYVLLALLGFFVWVM